MTEERATASRRPVALAAGLGVAGMLLAGLVLWGDARETLEVEGAAPTPLAPRAAELTGATPLTVSETNGVDTAPTESHEAPPAPSPRLALEAPGPRELVLEGRVELVGEDGSKRKNATGSFRLELRATRKIDPRSFRPAVQVVRVRFDKGHFRARFRRLGSGEFAFSGAPQGVSTPPLGSWIPDAELSVGNLYLSDGSRSLELAGTTGLTLGSESALVVAHEREAFRLHVRDALSGRDVEDVRVVPATSVSREGELPDLMNEWQRLVWDQASPVSIPRRRPASTEGARELSTRGAHWHVGAPGYAWTVAEFQVANAARHEVQLQPGGALEVQCSGAKLAPGTQVRVYSMDDPLPLASAYLSRFGTLAFEGLPVGPVEVRAEHGDPWDSPHIFARTTVDVCAGLSLPVLLELAPPEEPITVKVSGQLEFPSEWDALQFWIVFDLEGPTPSGGNGHRIVGQSAMQREGSSDRYVFDVAGLAPGKYQVRVRPVGFTTEIEVPHHGLSNLSLRVPPPVEVTIKTVHAESERHVPVSVLRWKWFPDALSQDRSSGVVRKKAGESAFRLRVPRGAVTVNCETYGFLPGVLSFDASPGLKLELPLKPRN